VSDPGSPVAVLFDMDGTLVDSRPGIVTAMNATLRALGEPERDPEDLRARIGPPLQETIGTLLGRPPGEVEDIAEAYRARYRKTMREETFVYPGIPELLADLAAAGHPMAVATSKAQPLAEELLDHLGLGPWFAAVCGPVPPSVEDKAATVARALDALGTREAVLVGDRHHDVTGAREHGVATIGAAWGYGGEDELWAAGARAIARRPDEVPGLLP
jgi:phosphoglycolate phosphatase